MTLDGTAEIIQGYGQPGATFIAGYSRSQFLGEIGMLTGQRAYLTAVATSAGRVLAVPVQQLHAVMAHEPGLSDLILRTFLLRHSILMRRGAGLTLIGSRYDPGTWPSAGCSSSSALSPEPGGWPASSPKTATDSCSPAPIFPCPGSTTKT